MSATKIGRNTTSILNCYFLTLWHIRLNIHIWKTKFTFYKQYFLGLPFSRNVKKSNTDQSLQQAFSFCLKRSVSLTFKNASYKKVFPKCVYDWYNLLCWMFFILCDNRKQYFFRKSYCYPEASCQRHVAAFFETSVLKEIRVLCPLSPK